MDHYLDHSTFNPILDLLPLMLIPLAMEIPMIFNSILNLHAYREILAETSLKTFQFYSRSSLLEKVRERKGVRVAFNSIIDLHREYIIQVSPALFLSFNSIIDLQEFV